MLNQMSYRPGRRHLVLGIICVAFFLMDVSSVYAAHHNIDRSFRHPQSHALVHGIFRSLCVLMGIHIADYLLHRLGIAMKVIPPTFWQRAIASDWLPRIWMLACPLAFTAWTVRSIGPLGHAFSNVWSGVLFVVVILLSALLGFMAAIPTGWLVLGPILMAHGERNGGPFVPGDLVQIVSGAYRNRVALVYSPWQHETVRVDLGEEAKKQYKDVFSAYQLLRAERPKQPDGGERSNGRSQ